MSDAADLLEVARLLLGADAMRSPSSAQLRRAVSTAYYAMFHKVLRAGAGRFMGPGHELRPGYNLIYRGFSHGRIRSVCAQVCSAVLSRPLQQLFGRTAVSPDMRQFAFAFIMLQDARHQADYDPHYATDEASAARLLNEATDAIQAFDRVGAEELTSVLALMLVNPRP